MRPTTQVRRSARGAVPRPTPQEGVPKYLQLRHALAAEIAAGRWKSGEKIPTEDHLTGTTGLSLGTVQRALRALAEDGLVVRRQGMGTFVADGERPMSAPFMHCRFLGEDGRTPLPIYSRVLQRRLLAGTGAWRPLFEAGARVLCIERVFSIDNAFRIYTHLYLDAARFPALASMPLAGLNGVNFKDLLARDYQLSLARFSETLGVAVFPPAVCREIGVKRGTSGARLEIVAYDRRGAPVYLQDLLIPPNSRRLLLG